MHTYYAHRHIHTCFSRIAFIEVFGPEDDHTQLLVFRAVTQRQQHSAKILLGLGEERERGRERERGKKVCQLS